MRILFLSDNFPPEVNAPAGRTFEHCREWVQAGARVTVITGAPNFPQGKIHPGYRNRLWSTEIVEGIRVIRVWTYISANQGFAKRVLDYVSFAVTSFMAGLLQQADLIVTTSPQFFVNFTGWGLSRIKGRPWLFELRDLWPDSIRTVGAMTASRALDLLERIELYFYREADRVIAVTPAFKHNLISRGIDALKIDVVPNGVNPRIFYPRPKNTSLLARLGLDGKFVIGYIGTHGMAHSLDVIVSSAKRIEDGAIHFLFIGDGAEKKRITTLAKEKGVHNITFLDPVPKHEVADYLGICDVALVPLKKSDTFKTVIPSKIFEAAAMQRPILLGVEGQAQAIVQYYDAGLCFEPENQADFISKLHLLKNDSALYQRLQAGGLRLAADFQRKNLALKMLTILAATAKRRHSGAVLESAFGFEANAGKAG